MAVRLQIRCINKGDRYNPHERILYIGGIHYDGSRWKISQANAVKGILDGSFAFYVNVAGSEVDVIVAESAQGNLYIKTKADGEYPNNLLSLPECP